MNRFNENYWQNRYLDSKTGWDIGYITTPLKEYVDQLKDKSLKILIPGCGNGYEAEYLHKQGFRNIIILDIAKQPLINFQKRVPSFPSSNLKHSNFFEFDETFDLILEHTFFCALDPNLRASYVTKTHELLTVQGKLVGLFFNFPLSKEGPPFGGYKNLYRDLFEDYFSIKILKTAYNSIPPRKDKELFFIFEKK